MLCSCVAGKDVNGAGKVGCYFELLRQDPRKSFVGKEVVRVGDYSGVAGEGGRMAHG